jgi:prepilin-type N-terminal cleavage/methylation domain-containing protein
MTDRRGFTLIEVMVALVLLVIVSLGLTQFTGSYIHSSANAGTRAIATEIARERIGLIRADPAYTSLASTWAGTTTGFPGYPGMSRTTTVRRVTQTTPRQDYTLLTVLVTTPSLPQAVTLTAVVAAP